MSCFIATLGSRDLILPPENRERFLQAIDINALSADQQKGALNEILESFEKNKSLSARKFGEFLCSLPNLDNLLEYLEAPILQAANRYFFTGNFDIHRVILVVTNQDCIHIHDTIYFGRIIKRLIVKNKWFSPVRENEIHLLEVKNNQLYLPDVMYEFFERKIRGRPFHDLDDNKKFPNIYVQPQGGIDALNQGLVYNLIWRFPYKIIYLSKGDKDQISRRNQFPAKFIQSFVKRQVMQFIRKYHYAQAAELSVDNEIKSWCMAAHYRLLFDFSTSFQILDNVKMNLNGTKTRWMEELHTLRNAQILDGVEPESLLVELFCNLEIKYRQENYADFLSRLFRLYECLCHRYAISRLQEHKNHLRLETEEYNGENWKNFFTPFIEADAELKDFLEKNQLNYQDRYPSTHLLHKLLEFFKCNITSLLQKIESLSSLRNKTIVAHGFKPVSKENIESVLAEKSNTNLENLLQEIRNFININGSNSFQMLNENLLNELE